MRNTLVISLAMLTSSSWAQFVYDNTVNNQGAYFNMNGQFETGDSVTLAGSDRQVTKFEAVMGQGASFDVVTVIARLYAGGTGAVAPGAMLWEGTKENYHLGSAPTNVAWDVPNIVVPNELTWTVELLGLGGIFCCTPPTVGTSESYFWRHDYQGNWGAYYINGYPDLGARVTAVPEPSSLLALLFVVPIAKRWRARRAVPTDR